jgi:hypothetical protein
MPLTRARIAQIAEKLRNMPPAPPADVPATKQEAVRLLAREITGLQRRGYALEEIVASLKGEGLDLSTPTLKSYLSRAKAGKVRRRRPSSPSRASEPAAAPLTPKAAAASTKAETPVKSGKDAFLVKDKDSY